MSKYEYLKPFCATPRQEEILAAVLPSPSNTVAAKKLNVTERNIMESRRRMRRHAADTGVSPDHGMARGLPEGQGLKGVSTLYDADGEIKQQWVKSQADAKSIQDDINAAIQAFKESVPKSAHIPKPKAKNNEDLLNFHVLTDYHLGMKAWHEDAGEDWDLRIAEDLLVNWFAYALKHAPSASNGVLAQMGDFLHFDGLEAVTPANHHVLDADTRFQKVVRVAIRSLRRIIHMMLKKYDHLHIVMADANHDPASSAWLREMFAAFYEDEPRISVDNTGDSYYCVEHGDTSLFIHHGHKKSVTNVDDVFAAKFREVWGRTKHSYAHLGHRHHVQSKETNLMIVEQHRTMAAKDTYASRGGWLSGRSAPVITYHKEYGQVGRQETTPEMVAK